MQSKNLIFLFLYLLNFPLLVKAQDFSVDIKTATAKYYEVQDFSMTVEAKVYFKKTSKVADQSSVSYVKKHDDSYKTTTDYVETLYNPSYVIAVSKIGKTIMYAPNDKKTPGLTEVFPMIDSAFSKYDSVVYKGLVGGDKMYTIYMSKIPSVKAVNIYIRPDFLFSKMEYILDEKNNMYKMEVFFKDIQTNPTFTKSEFAVSNYVSNTNQKKITPSKKYAGYQVIYNDFAEKNKKTN